MGVGGLGHGVVVRGQGQGVQVHRGGGGQGGDTSSRALSEGAGD